MVKSYELGLYEKAIPSKFSWLEMLLIAKQAGYDFLELSIDETQSRLNRLAMNVSQKKALCNAMFETGMPIRSMCLSAHRKYPLGSEDADTVQKSLEIARLAITLASDLGIRIIMLAGYDVYYEKSTKATQDRFLVNLEKVVVMAAAKGILLAFETMETPFMNTVKKAMKCVQYVGSPYLCVYPDIGNITNAAIEEQLDVTRDLEYADRHIVALHLKETVPGVYRNMMFGEGHVDFAKAIQTAWRLGVRRFTNEFWYNGESDWKERLIFARTFVEGHLYSLDEKLVISE